MQKVAFNSFFFFFLFRNIQYSLWAAMALMCMSTKCSLKTIDQEELSAVFTHHVSCSFLKLLWVYQVRVIHDSEGSSDLCCCTDICAKNMGGELQSIDGIQRKQYRQWWRAGSKDVQNEHHISLLLPLLYCIHILQLYWASPPPTVCHWFKHTAFLLS